MPSGDKCYRKLRSRMRRQQGSGDCFRFGWVGRANLSEEVTSMETQMGEEGSHEAIWGRLVHTHGSLAHSSWVYSRNTTAPF